jgi:hypothetical protein
MTGPCSHVPANGALARAAGLPAHWRWPAAGLAGRLDIPGTRWSVRIVPGGPGWPSLEVYAGCVLLDVVVATSLTPAVLRGACRANGRPRPQALAWGRLPAGRPPVRARFTRSGLRPQAQIIEVSELGCWFWLAVAEGDFSVVTVTHPGGQERRRLRKVRR